MPAVLIPGAGGLAKLVAELGAFLVLGLPADEARPVGEQGLVDDLDPANGLVLVLVDLVGGEQAGVDELAEDVGGCPLSVILSEGVRRSTPLSS